MGSNCPGANGARRKREKRFCNSSGGMTFCTPASGGLVSDEDGGGLVMKTIGKVKVMLGCGGAFCGGVAVGV